jgi:type I restriction enzyme S subunit
MSDSLEKLANIHYGKSPNEVVSIDGHIPIVGTGGIYGWADKAMFERGIVVARKGSLSTPHLFKTPFWPVDTTYAVVPKADVDLDWLFYCLLDFDLTKLNEATGVPSINRNWLAKTSFKNPGAARQSKIAAILTSIDTAIEKTEALIEKYQHIKAGLMHDLFTRGVLPNGQLRPPRDQAPELYQETAIGWIPKDWKLKSVSSVLESVADGPFGSNLKTEHYVTDPGVQVIRLQNVAEYEYNDDDKAYISDRHAAFLLRNKVVSGDVLIAGLGEERYPVGRACTYPEQLPSAINKADCFRARCVNEVMQNKFFMLFLNSELARRQIRRYEQGVTRPRINTGNLKRLFVGVPTISEQLAFIQKFEAAQAIILRQINNVKKLKSQKLGLMQDLLTGKVPVKIQPENLPESEAIR